MNSYFNGTIDEAAIWNRTLSAEEIKTLYYSGHFAPTGGQPYIFDSSNTSAGDNYTCEVILFDKDNIGTARNSTMLELSGNQSPIISLYNYTNFTTTDSTPGIDFNLTDDDSSFTCHLLLNGTGYGVNATTENATRTTITANASLNNGDYNITITCSDGLMTNASEPVILTVDSLGPDISFITPTPANSTILNQDNYFLNISASEAVNTLFLELTNFSGTINYTMDNATATNFYFNISGQDDYSTYLYVYANDSMNNLNRSLARHVKLDTTAPDISFVTPTPSNDTNLSQDNFFVNISVNEGANTALLELTNSSGTINYTMDNTTATNFHFNLTGQSDNITNFYVYANDSAGELNRSLIRHVGIDTTPPVLSGLAYSPASVEDVDPGANISFNITVSDALFSVDTVILQYWNGTTAANITMTHAGSGVYNASFVTSDNNYTFSIWANDTVGSMNQTANRTFQSEWDCTWLTDSAFGAVAGWDENTNIFNISINNTGDSPHSTSNCSLRFRLTYDLTEGRIYFDNDYIKPSNTYTVAAQVNQTVQVNASFLSEARQEDLVISVQEVDSRSNTSESNITTTLVSNQAGPYLYQSITSSPNSVSLTAGNFSLEGYIRNIMGSSIPNENNTAYNVSFYWTLASGFTNASGNRTQDYVNISDNTLHYNNINATFSSLADTTSGVKTFYLRVYGYNSTGDAITDASNQSLLSEETNITFLCYSTSDGVCVTACGYDQDPDCEQETIETTTTTESGGGAVSVGGGGLTMEQRSQLFETEEQFDLVRGDENAFIITLTNPLDQVLENVTVTMSGYVTGRLSLDQTYLGTLQPNQSINITVSIEAPKYLSRGLNELTLKMEGKSRKYGLEVNITEERAINLIIHEISKEAALGHLDSLTTILEQMKDLDLVTKDVEEILSQSDLYLTEGNYIGVQSNEEAVQSIFEAATEAKDNIEKLDSSITQAEYNGIDTPQSLRLTKLAKAAMARGDFTLARSRADEALLTFAAETKGEFNVVMFILRNWWQIWIAAMVIAAASFFIYIRMRIFIITRKLKNLDHEEEVLLGLIKEIQHECFDLGKMSMREYKEAVIHYEKKLSRALTKRVNLGSARLHIMTFHKLKALKHERDELIKILKETQSLYLEQGKIETHVYKNKMTSVKERLAVVEEELTTMEAEREIKRTTTLRGRLMDRVVNIARRK